MGNQNSGNKRSRSSSRHNLPNAESEDLDIDVTNSNECPVVFKWHVKTHPIKNVHVSGSWDNWKNKIPLVKSTHNFSTILNLNPGRYEYKYLVDGKWMIDENMKKAENPLGGHNNVITIDASDFEVFEALEKDLASSNSGNGKENSTGIANHNTPDVHALEQLHEFSQDLPTRADFEKVTAPALPPHLLKILLNEDFPNSSDDSLPEPPHCMLHHIFAPSIKDQVMGLSVTKRVSASPDKPDKYVTTLLYSPL